MIYTKYLLLKQEFRSLFSKPKPAAEGSPLPHIQGIQRGWFFLSKTGMKALKAAYILPVQRGRNFDGSL